MMVTLTSLLFLLNIVETGFNMEFGYKLGDFDVLGDYVDIGQGNSVVFVITCKKNTWFFIADGSKGNWY